MDEAETDIKTDVKDLLSTSTDQVSTIDNSDAMDELVVSADTQAKSYKSDEIREKAMMDDDDGEDLPDNFFDDFSNNDFMAGLDIVDDWMDDEEEADRKHDPEKDDYFQDDALVREKSIEQKQEQKKEPSSRKTRHSPKREDERYRRNRERSFERFDRRRSRERGFEHRRSRSRDRYRNDRRSRERHRSRGHSKPKENDRSPKQNSKDQKSEDDASRRDPEKTRQDIQRDKIRCAKDFEARVFQEQIKVSETGLVPPGTELDVVLEHEKRKHEEEQKHLEKPVEIKKDEPVQPMEQKRSVERRGKDPKNHRRSSRERLSRERDRRSRDRLSRERRSRERHERSRERRSRDRRSRERRSRDRRSRERHSREHRRSRDHDLRIRRSPPDYRSRKRDHYSPRLQRRSRSLDKEELLRINDDLRLRIREKRRERYLNELSPVSEEKFSRSPSLSNLSLLSNVSEREFWLRSREKHKSRYRRSCSPISSSSLSDTGSPRRKRRKASFMEEIERKLREKQAQGSNFANIPQPVPPPQQFPQHMPMGMQYPVQNSQMFPGMVPNPYPQIDHNMMMQQPVAMMNVMGTPTSGILGPIPGLMDHSMMPQGHSPMSHVINPLPMQVQLEPGLNSPARLDSSMHRTASNLKPCVSDANKEVTKLFEEQKISLSDYLSVAAKPIDSTLPPINVHKKIKVISKCQDVIRVLKEDTKFCGRFFPKPAPPGFEKPEEKSARWRSPMRKTFPVRFMFTTPCRKNQLHQDFVKTVINKLLFVCGIPALPETPKTVGAARISSTNSKPIQNITTHTSRQIPAPVSFTVAQQKPKSAPILQPSVLIKRSTTGSQTEPLKCQICEIRSARKYSDEACQTSHKETVDESTQVTNEDLQKSIVTFTPRGILKNSGSNPQSLSHLTPAQLLALQQEKNDDGWSIASRNDSFSTSRNDGFPAARNLQDQFNPTANFAVSPAAPPKVQPATKLTRRVRCCVTQPDGSRKWSNIYIPISSPLSQEFPNRRCEPEPIKNQPESSLVDETPSPLVPNSSPTVEATSKIPDQSITPNLSGQEDMKPPKRFRKKNPKRNRGHRKSLWMEASISMQSGKHRVNFTVMPNLNARPRVEATSKIPDRSIAPKIPVPKQTPQVECPPAPNYPTSSEVPSRGEDLQHHVSHSSLSNFL